MSPNGISKHNVGRIAERIVSNELEFRGFRVSDLNKEGTSANADLLAAREGNTWQIQVKGSTEDHGWWWGYGFCSDAIIAGKEPMSNRSLTATFYKADIVVLVCVKSPNEYSCLVLPEGIAEKAAQLNIDREFRRPKKRGTGPKKPGKVWIDLDSVWNIQDPSQQKLLEQERELLKTYRDNWEAASTNAATA